MEVRLIHAKEPGPIFREEFDRYPILSKRLERALCPRVHFKMMIFDLDEVYIGSANLTGAGIGMKGAKTRNFEVCRRSIFMKECTKSIIFFLKFFELFLY